MSATLLLLVEVVEVLAKVLGPVAVVVREVCCLEQQHLTQLFLIL